MANQVIINTHRISIGEAVEQLKAKGIGTANIKNLHSDMRIFFNAYQTNQIFGELHYLNEIDKESYIPNSVELHPMLLGYILYCKRETSVHTSTTSIGNLLQEEGQVGRVFLINDLQLRNKLHELEFKGILKVSRIADLDNCLVYTIDIRTHSDALRSEAEQHCQGTRC